MTHMLETIVPKSDQMNADDLIGGQTRTIKITKVSILAGEQPVALSYENDGGKPYKPGKSMRRVIVNVWGPDANKYVGRSLTLYRDDKVKFGGVEVGGLRVSHMSHITEPVTMALTATRANRKPFTVKSLGAEETPTFEDWLHDIKTVQNLQALEYKFKEAAKLFTDAQQRAQLVAAKDARKAELTSAPGEPNV